MENPPEDRARIVAVLDGCIVGSADVFHHKGRRRHVGDFWRLSTMISRGAASDRP